MLDKVNLRHLSKVSWGLTIFVVTACLAAPFPEPTPTPDLAASIMPNNSPLTSSNILTSTSTNLPVLAATSQPTSTSTLSSSLMPGEYVVFLSGSGFQVVSADGTVRGKLGESFNDEDVALSPDAKFYAVGMGNKLVVLDLEQNTVKETSDKDICSYRIASPSWSPDSKLIAFVCDQSIGIASLQNETIIELVPRSPVFPAASWTMPLWSPDGHWIVYSQIVGQAGADNFNGPYVVDISCLSAPSTCESKTKQLSEEIEGVMAWTPDSRLAIAPSHKEIGSSSAIRVYDVETGQLLETIDVLEGSRVESMAWSPDGKWIAVSQFDPADYNFAIFLIPSAGGQPVRLTIGERVVSWLTVP